MRTVVPMAVILALSMASGPVYASGVDSKPLDQQGIEALETRASQAQPREQCFLYAELVHQMTELSVRQYAAGDVGKATEMLRHIQLLAQKIHLSMANNDKRLKNAEILLRHTAFRLTEMLHGSSSEDRPLLEQTLAQVNEAQTETMMQVFRNK